MGRAMVVAFVLSAALASTAFAGGWRIYHNAGKGFSIAVPAGWQVVPHATADVRKLATRMQAEHRAALAAQLEEIAANRRTQPAVYSFQALQWPAPKGATIPDVTVKVDTVARTARLSVIATQFEKALGSPKGATVEPPAAVKLPAGAAVRIAGTTRLGPKLHAAYVVYLILRPGRLYSVAFRCLEVQERAEAPLFTRIASRFQSIARR